MKKIFSLLFALAFCFLANAQKAKEVFVRMPDSLSLMLTAVNRADFIDFLESNMKAQVENKMGKMSEMTELSDDYINLKLTSQSNWQMKMLPVTDSTKIVCVVSTACAPVCDSQIQFYTTGWQELNALDYITLPGIDSYFNAPDSAATDAFNRARLHADILLVKANFTKDDAVLTLTFTTPEYIEKETADKLKPFIRRTLRYEWKENRFVLAS